MYLSWHITAIKPLSRQSFFFLKMSPAFMSAAYFQMHSRLDFMTEANMNPNQTGLLLWEQSDLGPYYLQYKLLKVFTGGEKG